MSGFVAVVAGAVAKSLVTRWVSGLYARGLGKLLGSTHRREVASCVDAAVRAFIGALPGAEWMEADKKPLEVFFTEDPLPALLQPLQAGRVDRVEGERVVRALAASPNRPDAVDEATLRAAWAAFTAAYRVRLAGTERLREVAAQGAREELLGGDVSLDLTPYVEATLADTSALEIRGLQSESGAGARALVARIEDLYTPLHTTGGHPRGGLESEPGGGRITLPELFASQRHLLLVGQPGSGKTTTLRLVCSLTARDWLGEPGPGGATWCGAHLGVAQDPPPIPALVRLSLLADQIETSPKTHRLAHEEALLDYLQACCQHNEHPYPRSGWAAALEAGDVLLLFDGLDEVADDDLREVVFKVFRATLATWPACRVVVTSRPFDTGPVEALGFEKAAIAPFDEPALGRFLDRWVTALYARELAEAPPGHPQHRYREALEAALEERPRLRAMASSPVMLTALCVIHWNEGRLPNGRAMVYAAVIRWLLRAREAQRRAAGFSQLFAETAFAALALHLMGPREGDTKRVVIDRFAAAEALEPVVARFFDDLRDPADQRARAEAWLEHECLGSGVVEKVGRGRLRFWHLTFQEYLAAWQLARMRDGESGPSDWWPILRPRLGDAQWRETVELLGGCLLPGGIGRVDGLVERILALRGDDPDLAADARVAGVAGRVLATLSAYEYPLEPALRREYADVLARAQALFTREGAAQVPIAERLPAAIALGQGGDPRLRKTRENFAPVPGLPKVSLSLYPVTVEEYARFVDDRGYERREVWGADWPLREAREWAEPGDWAGQLQRPSAPVVRVSWLEAAAYCRWLGRLWRRPVRLPKKAEWERCATPPGGGRYPWGDDEPTGEHANFDNNVGYPTPVGVYPRGAGPEGHLDLAGNVWEWCVDNLTTKRPERDKTRRPLRGGSWVDSALYLRSAIRYRNGADYRFGFLGFRVALAPSSRLLEA